MQGRIKPILHLEDWKTPDGKYTAVVQSNTKNKSFLRMAVLLKKMGIQNCYFQLSLLDPKLLDVDPHNLDDENDPTQELRLRVAVECKLNPWYFFREVVRIPAQGSSPVPFKLHRGNLAMLWCFFNNINFTSTQPRQTGKALINTQLVKIPGGWEQIGNLKVNDEVVAADGTTTKVTGVYPQGKLPLWRITFQDGRTIDCCENHLWKIHNKHWSPEDTNWRVIPTKDIIEYMSREPRSSVRMAVPLAESEKNPPVNVPLDPYVVGALLGDGAITHNSIGLIAPDEFIADEFRKLIPGVVVTPYASGKCGYSVVDRSEERTGNRSTTISALRYLKMWGKCAWEKSIPEVYMRGSTEQRLHLLQGMMDTDGTVDKKGSMEYSTTSRVLAYQVQQLAWSLSGICTVKPRQTHYTYKGERKPGRISYRIRIRFADPTKAFRLPRKKDLVPTDYKWKDCFKLYIKSIEPVDSAEATCISVDHPEKLFVAENHVVTHNTICAVAICCYVIYVAGVSMEVAMLTHNNDVVQANVKRVKDIRDTIPSYLIRKGGIGVDLDNKEGLFYKKLNNTYKTFTAQKDRKAANNVGRGCTAPFIHGDETAFVWNIDITFPALMAITNAARESAKAAGQYYANIFTTTAGDPSTTEGKYMFDYIQKAMKFTEKLYDTKDEAAAHALVKMNSTNELVDGTFSYLQLGYSKEWFNSTVERLNLPRSAIARDFLNQWVTTSDNPIINKSYTDRMYATMKSDPDFTEVRGDYIINWYVPPHEVLRGTFRRKPLIMGMDTSEMIGKDFSTCVAIDPHDLSVIFTFRCNESNTTKLGIFIAELLSDYPEIIFVPERKSTAISIIDNVILVMQKNGQNPFKRIYNRIVDNYNLDEYKKYDLTDPNLVNMDGTRRFIGFMTSGKTRPVLYKEVLQKAAMMSADKIYDKELINELSGLQARNGRLDHGAQSHDDMVMAWLLACYVVFEGKNLSFYGLDPRTILQAIESKTGKKNPLYIQKQMELRQRIKSLVLRARSTEDQFIKRKLMYDLDQLTPYLDDSINVDPLSVDALRQDSFDYRDIHREISSAGKTPAYRPDQIFNALYGRGEL